MTGSHSPIARNAVIIMVETQSISTPEAPQNDNPYSQGVIVDGLLFVSGFGPVSPETMETVNGDIGIQTSRVIENLQAVVEEAGGSLADVVKTTVYVTDMADYDQVNETYGEYFDEDPPARVCIEAARLPDNVSVEIDAIVAIE
nr:Rid family detoxifying hydrolase [Halocatena marina]